MTVRWWSKLRSWKSVISCYNAIKLVIERCGTDLHSMSIEPRRDEKLRRDTSIKLTTEHLKTAQLIVDVLEHVELVQTALSGENYVTMSLVLPLMVALEQQLRAMRKLPQYNLNDLDLNPDTSECNQTAGFFLMNLHKSLWDRIVHRVSSDPTAVMAAFVDWRFKELVFLQPAVRLGHPSIVLP